MYNLDYYKILNVAPKATEAEIKASFIKTRQGASPEQIQKMNEAYQVLSDNNERAKYDQWYMNQDSSKLGSSSTPTPHVATPGITTGAPSVKAVEKNNNISMCNKSQWDSLYRQVINANARGQNKSSIGSGNLKKFIIWTIIVIVFTFAI